MRILDTTPLENIVVAGRNCYDSVEQSEPTRDIELLKNWKNNNHLSVFDHFWFKLKFSQIALFENIFWNLRINIDKPFFRYIYVDKNFNLYINLRTIFEIEKENMQHLFLGIYDSCMEHYHKQLITYTGLTQKEFLDGVNVLFKQQDFPFITLYLKNCFSRDTLHQFIRHYSFRSVKSTRYTLNKKKLTIDDFILPENENIQNYIQDYIVSFEKLKQTAQNNDVVKSALIESLKTSGVFTFYQNDFDNMLTIRDENNKKVYWKFRDLITLIKTAVL